MNTNVIGKISLFLSIALSSFLLSSCSGNYTFSSNLDTKNFQEYFKPSKVEIFENEKDIVGHYKLIGMVEGESCQLKAHHAPPNEIDARTQARSKAYDLGANGIVFTSCIQLDDMQCTDLLVCYGQIYTIEQDLE